MIYLIVVLYLLAGVGSALDGLEFDKAKAALNRAAGSMGISGDLETPHLEDKKMAIIVVCLIWPVLALTSIFRELRK